jgi:RNA polymerase sigma-70 factor (ECF subfamily)
MYSESQLILELRNGSHKAFRQLFDEYKKRVYGFLYNMLHSHEETEELLQTVFVKIWENRTSLNHELSLNAYVFKIAKHSALNVLRQKAYKLLLEKQLVDELNISEESASHLDDKDLKQYVNDLIMRIPKRRRDIFLLRYRQKKSYKEIAEELHISENTVDTQIRRALSFLREQLGNEFAGVIYLLAYYTVVYDVF